MTARSFIRRFDFKPLDIALHTPFGISGGAQAMANNVLVTVELDGGFTGYGEAAPLPPYNGETQAMALAALRSGQIDAMSNTDPVMTMLEQKGEVKVVSDTRTLKGTVDVFLAIERGEVDGMCGLDWSSLKSQRPDWLRDKKINLLVQTALDEEAEVTGLEIGRAHV